MMVPSERLLLWMGFAGIPLVTLAYALPDYGLPALGLFVVMALVAAGDALAGQSVLAGISANLPPLVRLTKHHPAVIPITVRNQRGNAQTVEFALSLASAFHSSQDKLPALLPASLPAGRIEWLCHPRRRGSFPVTAVYLQAPSPLGLWDVRGVSPTRCEIRVYPNLRLERQGLAALFLHRGAMGVHTQRQVGKGREFEKLRDYVPGDDPEDIHWKASARRGELMTKVFQIERTQEIYVAIDASRLSRRDVPEPPALRSTETRMTTQLERFITASLVIGLAAEQQGDHIGLLSFSDRVHRFIRAGSGAAHFQSLRDAIYHQEALPVTPDFSEMATFVRLHLRRRALIIILTSLDDRYLAEQFLEGIRLISRQHLVIVGLPRPAQARPLFSRTPDSMRAIYEDLGGHMLWRSLQELQRDLQQRGVRLCLLEQEQLAASLVSEYLSIKRRQLL
jgi:uncharacterized protein (DUF58 family)